jgi:hypothetical protein
MDRLNNNAKDLKKQILARIATISNSHLAAAATVSPSSSIAAFGRAKEGAGVCGGGLDGVGADQLSSDGAAHALSLQSLQSQPPTAIQSEAMAAIQQLQEQVRAHPQWAGASAQELEIAEEAIEKLVTLKLYHLLFAASQADLSVDALLHRRLQCLQFLGAQHLDIDREVVEGRSAEACLQVARRELCKMNDYKSPRDKLICIYNCCKLASRIVTLTSEKSSGADELLPLLILLVIQANPSSLHSNLSFICNCRDAARLNGEQGYFLTNILSAAHFLTTVCDEDGVLLDPGALSIDAGEFQRQFHARKHALGACPPLQQPGSQATDVDEVCICLFSCIRLPSTHVLGLPCEASASAGDSLCPYLSAATGASDGSWE